MKRQFAWLFALGAVATVLSFPFPPPLPALALALVAVALLVAGGLWFGAPHGLGSKAVTPMRAVYALLIGAVAGAVTLAMLPLAGLQSRIIGEAAIPLWKRFVIAFDSSILEELIFRLFLVSFVVWLLARFMRRDVAVWIALVISALAFGAAHLNRWMSAGPEVIAAVMLVNGVIAIAIGLVYVRWGIEAAILSHFAGDVTVHVIGPYLFT